MASFSDNFNRSDRSLNGDNGWSYLVGSTEFDIASNELQVGSSPGDVSVTNSGATAANGYIQADIKLGTGTSVGLIFRVQDANNFYLLDCDVAGWYFYKRSGGSYSLLTTQVWNGGSWSNGVYHTVRITFDADDFEIFLDGVSEQVLANFDSTFSASGPGGLRNGSGGSNPRTVDNFVFHDDAAVGLTGGAAPLFRGRHLSFFDDEEVNRFEFWPAITASNNVVVTPSVASLSTTGLAPVIALAVIPDTANLTTSTFAPGSVVGTILSPDVASLTTSTFAPTVSVSDNKSVTPDTASLTTSSFAPQVNLAVIPSTASLTLTGFEPTANVGNAVSVTPDTAVLTTSTFAPSVNVSDNLSVTPDTASLATSTFSVSLALAVSPSTANLITEAFAPAANIGINLDVPNASLTTSTFEPTITVTAHVTVTPDTASLSTSTFAPVLAETVSPSTLSVTTTTFEPTVSATEGVTVTPDTLALALNTFQPTVDAGGHFIVEPGVLNLTTSTFSPTLYFFTATVSSDRVYVVDDESRVVVVEESRITIVEDNDRITIA